MVGELHATGCSRKNYPEPNKPLQMLVNQPLTIIPLSFRLNLKATFMKRSHKSLLTLCIALATATSCHKSNYDAGNNTIITDNNASLLEVFKPAPQSFSVIAGVPKDIVGEQGTLLRFYANSFRDKNGNIIAAGTVNIELTELYSAGDILKNHTSTTTGAGVLTSGGEVYIKATTNGEEVFPNKYGLGFSADGTPATGPRELFFGNTYATEGIVTWGSAGGPIGTTVPGKSSVSSTGTSLPTGQYYMFDSCTAFNWVAAHHDYSGSFQNITVKVKLSNVKFGGKVWSTACMGLGTERVACLLYQESFDVSTQTGVYKGWAPTGTAQKFMLMMPRDKATWYYYKTEQAITDGMTINATMTQAYKVDMETALKSF